MVSHVNKAGSCQTDYPVMLLVRVAQRAVVPHTVTYIQIHASATLKCPLLLLYNQGLTSHYAGPACVCGSVENPDRPKHSHLSGALLGASLALGGGSACLLHLRGRLGAALLGRGLGRGSRRLLLSGSLLLLLASLLLCSLICLLLFLGLLLFRLACLAQGEPTVSGVTTCALQNLARPREMSPAMSERWQGLH